MLDRLIKICENTKRLDPDKLLKKVFNDPAVKEYVITLQQNQMYDHGVDGEGKPLGDYSEASVKHFGKRPGHIQMFETGKFFGSLKVKSAPEEVVISANTIKTAWDGAIDLLDRWPKLLGLNSDSLPLLRTFIKPIFIDYSRAEILAQG